MAKLVKYGSRLGWNFTVVTARDFSASTITDRSLLTEVPENVKIIHVDNPLLKNGFFSNYLSGLISGSSYWKRWLSAFRYIPDIRRSWLGPVRSVILDELHRTSYDCILVSSPPYSLTMLAVRLQEESGLPVITDFRDPWTSNPYKLHPTPYHFIKDRQMEFSAVRKIKHGISAYGSLLDYYQMQIPDFDAGKWHVIPNGFDEADFINLRAEAQDERFFNLAFSGTFYSHINNPEPLFKAIAILKTRQGLKRKIRFHHIGQAFIDVTRLAASYGIESDVILHGYLDHKTCLSRLAGMDGVFFILDNRHRHGDKTIGGKVYEYLRFKKPILALIPEHGEAAGLIRETDSGEVIAPDQSDRIADTLQHWIQESPSYTFRHLENYSRQYQAGLFIQVMNRSISHLDD